MTWENIFEEEFKKDYFPQLKENLLKEYKKNIVYPAKKDVMNAFSYTTFSQVKVVIIGQDPYHNPKEAEGLAFSVPENVKAPPSLQNIMKELNNDLGIKKVNHSLIPWAKQGVLLLNSILTVRKNEPGSHKYLNWEQFTNDIIEALALNKTNLVFILWGNYARSKKYLIKGDHLIIESPHPSPFSANRGFFNSHPFSQTNNYLIKNGKTPIDWSL